MKKTPEVESIVNTLVSATDPEKVKGLYAQWAQSYDDDLDSFGYVAPGIGVKMLSGLIENKHALIHDAGYGTGQVGALLRDTGYATIHGSDFSIDMLDKARALNCYEQLQTIDFGEPIEISNDQYDAVISIGVYTKRFKQHFINEMLRIVKPGGYFIFSCRELYYDEVMSSATLLLKDNTISNLIIDFDDYMTGEDASAYYVAMRKRGEK